MQIRINTKAIKLANDEEQVEVWREDDIAIVFNADNARFTVKQDGVDPEWEDHQDSFKAAADRAEKRIKARAAAEKRKMGPYQALSSDGQPVEIKSIHSGHGKLVTSPPLGDRGGVYPREAWISEFMRRRKTLTEELSRIEKHLSEVRVSSDRKSYGAIDPEKYNVYVDDFVREFEAAQERAKHMQGPDGVRMPERSKSAEFYRTWKRND